MRDEVVRYLEENYSVETIIAIEKVMRSPKKLKVVLADGSIKYPRKQNYKFTRKDGVNTYFNIKTGSVVFEDGRCENAYYHYITPMTNSLFTDVNDIMELKDKLLEFVDGPKKLFGGKSDWSTGKTQHCVRALLDLKNKNDKPRFDSILFPTEINSFNSELLRKFGDYGFVSHLQEQSKEVDASGNIIQIKEHPFVICSVQSMHKVEDKQFKLVIVDEAESVLSSYISSSTFHSAKKTPLSAFKVLKQIIQSADKVVLLDADLSDERMKIWSQLVGGNSNCEFYNNTQKVYQDITIDVVVDEQHWTNQITTDIMNGKKLGISTAVRRKTDSMLEKLKTTDDKYLYFSSKGVNLLHKDTITKYDKEKTILTLEDTLIELDAHFLTTPSTKTGISVDKEIYDTLYAYSSKWSITYVEFLQMFFRLRKLKDKKIVVYLDDPNKNGYNKTPEFIQNQQHFLEAKYKQLRLVDEKYETCKSDEDEDYYRVQTINMWNRVISRENYAYNLLGLLNGHSLKYNFVSSKTYKELEQDDIDVKSHVINIQVASRDNQRKIIYDWIATPMLNYFEYQVIDALSDCEMKQLDESKYLSFRKTKDIYEIFNVLYRIKYEFDDYISFDKQDGFVFSPYKNQPNKMMYYDKLIENEIPIHECIKEYHNIIRFPYNDEDEYIPYTEDEIVMINQEIIKETSNSITIAKTIIDRVQEMVGQQFYLNMDCKS